METKEEKCLWCGKTKDEHMDKPLDGATPKVPCMLLKEKFVPRKNQPPQPPVSQEVEEVIKEFEKTFPHKENDGGFSWLDAIGDESCFPTPSEVKKFIRQHLTAQYKQGYNQSLKDRGLTGEEYINLYL